MDRNNVKHVWDVEDLKHVCDTFEEPWVILITNELKCATMSKNLIMHDVIIKRATFSTCNMENTLTDWGRTKYTMTTPLAR